MKESLKRPKSEYESFEIGAGQLENAATFLESGYAGMDSIDETIGPLCERTHMSRNSIFEDTPAHLQRSNRSPSMIFRKKEVRMRELTTLGNERACVDLRCVGVEP